MLILLQLKRPECNETLVFPITKAVLNNVTAKCMISLRRKSDLLALKGSCFNIIILTKRFLRFLLCNKQTTSGKETSCFINCCILVTEGQFNFQFQPKSSSFDIKCFLRRCSLTRQPSAQCYLWMSNVSIGKESAIGREI